MNVKQMTTALKVAALESSLKYPIVYVEVNGEVHEVVAVENETKYGIIVIKINERVADV